MNFRKEVVYGLYSHGYPIHWHVFQDQPVDYFRCDEIPETILLRPATKIVRGKAVNNAGENVISNGSLFDVGVNQCAIFVENGQVHDLCAEPGQYRYTRSRVGTFYAGRGIERPGPQL